MFLFSQKFIPNLIFLHRDGEKCKNLHHSISQNVRRVFECEVRHENAKWGKERGITFPSKASSLLAVSACLGYTAWLGSAWLGLACITSESVLTLFMPSNLREREKEYNDKGKGGKR